MTGGGSGIGRATAITFANEGAVVAIVDREPSRIRGCTVDRRARLRSSTCATVNASERCSRRSRSASAGSHVLVNNAGLGDLRPLHTLDEKLWHRLIDVNLTGTYNGMRAAMPHHARTGRRRDREQRVGLRDHADRNEAAYSAAKAGVIALTKSGALGVRTDRARQLRRAGSCAHSAHRDVRTVPGRVRGDRQRVAAGRMGEPDEIAEVIFFLASALELHHRADDRDRRRRLAPARRHRRRARQLFEILQALDRRRSASLARRLQPLDDRGHPPVLVGVLGEVELCEDRAHVCLHGLRAHRRGSSRSRRWSVLAP